MTQTALPLPGIEPAPMTNTTSFSNNMALPVHRWFRYSAGFSAEWAGQVVRQTGARRVLDPFAGSGTSLLAAEAAGAEAVGVDIHPLVARVARAKLAWRADPTVLAERGKAVLARSSTMSASDVTPPTSPLIGKCFPPETLAVLLTLRDSITAESQGDAYDELLWLALLGILRACSPVGTAQWQYVLPAKNKAQVAEARAAFAQQARMMVSDMRTRQRDVHGPPSRYVEEDARHCASVPDGWADLVITSPPYANNFDYADATRLEMSFLGEIEGWGDLKALRQKLMRSSSQQMTGFDADEALSSPLLAPIADELGEVYRELDRVRMTKGGRKAYHSMVVAYFLDSAQVWASLRRACAAGAQACFVIGDSAPYGVHAPVERWLAMLALASGFESWRFEKVRDRNVKWENRKHRVPLHEGRLWVDG